VRGVSAREAHRVACTVDSEVDAEYEGIRSVWRSYFIGMGLHVDGIC
jgi:hypothetical protein